MRERLVHAVWESPAPAARAARGALRPAAWLYAAVVASRNAAYDSGWLPSRRLALPSVSVGNLTVGGTGKTPVAAYLASRLAERGLKPAIVMRGYGSDEALVHARLNPEVPVVVGADRERGVAEARSGGRTVAVLDDAFQHRRVRRDADVVLLAAERSGPVRLLPAGPWREPCGALSRASLIVVTRKAAAPERARALLATAARYAPSAGGAIVHLAAGRLVHWESSESRDLAVVRDRRVLAAAAIGDPRAFAAQLTEAGAHVELLAWPDHHAYSAADAVRLARRAGGVDMVVCTLKDAVKLGPRWPREGPPLWYLSQRVVVESGAAEFERLFARLAAIHPTD